MSASHNSISNRGGQQVHSPAPSWWAQMEAMVSQLHCLRDLSSHPCRYFLKLAISELSEGVQNSTKPYGICIKGGIFFHLVQIYSLLYLIPCYVNKKSVQCLLDYLLFPHHSKACQTLRWIQPEGTFKNVWSDFLCNLEFKIQGFRLFSLNCTNCINF